jgi:hypothetical protein
VLYKKKIVLLGGPSPVVGSTAAASSADLAATVNEAVTTVANAATAGFGNAAKLVRCYGDTAHRRVECPQKLMFVRGSSKVRHGLDGVLCDDSVIASVSVSIMV